MRIDHYTEFFINKPDLETTLKEFGEKFKIPVEKKLRAIKNRDEFLSEIIEYRFGMFFGSLFNTIEHERKVFAGSNFTPDWTVTSNEQLLVAEVIRLNSSQSDSEEMRISDTLRETLQNIAGDYVVQLKYKYEEIKDIFTDFEQLKISFVKWLKTNPEAGNFTKFDNKISITVTHKNVGRTEVGVIGAFRKINFDYRRLAGEKSRLFSKLKYADAVNQHQLPYLICIHLSFESLFEPEDMYKKLYGRSSVFFGDEPFNEFYPDAQFHEYAEGLYYCNETIKSSVSGVVVYYQGNFTFFPNYCYTNRLSKDSIRMLNNYLYDDLKV